MILALFILIIVTVFVNNNKYKTINILITMTCNEIIAISFYDRGSVPQTEIPYKT